MQKFLKNKNVHCGYILDSGHYSKKSESHSIKVRVRQWIINIISNSVLTTSTLHFIWFSPAYNAVWRTMYRDYAVAKFIVPNWGDTVDSGIGLSYPARHAT